MKKVITFFALIMLVCGSLVAQTKTATKNLKYRATIDFISKGSGIDGESYTKIENFIKNHPKKPIYEVKHKGKEGETKILLKLTELTKEEQITFMDEIKKLIVKADLVLITETGITPILNVKPQALAVTNLPGTNNYRLVLSFISKGGGIDGKTYEKIKEFIEKHPKKPAFETHRWGREGETDYCLHLKELTAVEQTVFIEDINKLITDKEMVLVYENNEYVKKGR